MSTEHTLSEALETAQARIAELEAAKLTIFCVHCGQHIPYEDGDRDGALSKMKAHDATCPMHPMAKRVAELEAALRWYADKANYHTYGTDICDKETLVELDEGERARAALSSTPPVAVWPRVFVDDVGEYVIFLNQGTVGEWFAPDGRTTERYTPMNGIVYSQSFGETDRELHGESRLAALAKCGLDENGKAIKKDGV